MRAQIRLWVSNQHVIGADSDNTDGHLEDLKWKHGSIITVPANSKALTNWFQNKFLPLQAKVAANGWGGDDTEHLPQPILTAFALGGRFESDRSLMEIYSAEEDCNKWVQSVLKAVEDEDPNA